MNPQPAVEFASLGLSAPALAALARMGFEKPTPIQTSAIPPVLAGHDVIGCAATGTGKTAAFVLPMLEKLTGKKGTRALVLAPTRELAEQIAEHVEKLAHGRPTRCATVIGGVGMGPQADAFRKHVEIIVATPGRLVDHLDRGSASLADVEFLVLDEADRMLDMGFKPQLDRILARLPKARQTLLFSATMAGEVATFAARHLARPVRVEVARSGTTAARAEQCVYLCSQAEKGALLLELLAADHDSTLVFTRTKHRADKVARLVERAGHAVSRIHGNRSQSQRRSSLEGFKDGTHRVLVATDIAARGIDVEEIGHVILFDLPHVPEDYVHRVGRTARASASGRASSFCAPDEADLLRDIEKLLRRQLPRAEVPRDSDRFLAARAAEETKVQRPHAHAPRHASHARHAPSRKPSSSRPSGGGGSSGGGGGGGAPVRVGSWKPRRR